MTSNPGLQSKDFLDRFASSNSAEFFVYVFCFVSLESTVYATIADTLPKATGWWELAVGTLRIRHAVKNLDFGSLVKDLVGCVKSLGAAKSFNTPTKTKRAELASGKRLRICDEKNAPCV